MQKEITPAGDIITAAIEKYNSTVSDIYKMKFNYTELSIFVDAMEQYANKNLAALQNMTPEQIKEEAAKKYPMPLQSRPRFERERSLIEMERAAYIAGATAHGKGECAGNGLQWVKVQSEKDFPKVSGMYIYKTKGNSVGRSYFAVPYTNINEHWNSLGITEWLSESAAPVLQQKYDAVVKLLESLTPGGSEFYNDPEYCVKYVKDLIASFPKMLLEERKKYDAVREALEVAMSSLTTYGKHPIIEQKTKHALTL